MLLVLTSPDPFGSGTDSVARFKGERNPMTDLKSQI